jgi:glutaredoxin-like YruB-family protein
MDSKVIIYSAAWCAYCHAAKEYLDKLGVKYEDHDVDHEPTAAKEAEAKSGQRAIPVIDIGGDIIIGFDRPKIDQSLKAHQLIT